MEDKHPTTNSEVLSEQYFKEGQDDYRAWCWFSSPFFSLPVLSAVLTQIREQKDFIRRNASSFLLLSLLECAESMAFAARRYGLPRVPEMPSCSSRLVSRSSAFTLLSLRASLLADY
jgi:hypothetical protein